MQLTQKSHYQKLRERVLLRTVRVRRAALSPIRRATLEREATATALLQLLEFTVSRETSVIGVHAGSVPPELEALIESLREYRQALEELYRG